MNISLPTIGISLIFFGIIKTTIACADELHMSEDYLYHLHFLKLNDIHNVSPAHYNSFKTRGLKPRPRLFELMRRVGLNHSAFGDLDNQDLPTLLISQIDKKLIDDIKKEGLASLRIIVSDGNNVIRILYFDRENKNNQDLTMTHWIRNFPDAMIDRQTVPSDWKDPIKVEKKWTRNDFLWLKPIFDDPMPPVDFPSEIINPKPPSFIFEMVTIEDGTAVYQWAIRSSLQTSGYRRLFEPLVDVFLQNINESLALPGF